LRRHGSPPLSTEALLRSANFTLSLLPVRLAHRVRALRNLPYVVVSNPNISKIYDKYRHSLSTLLPYQQSPITTPQQEIHFTQTLHDLVQTHADTIPTLARGFVECRKYIPPAKIARFLDEHLRARIGTRLIAQHHIELHLASQTSARQEASKSNGNETILAATPSTYIGVIDTALRPARIIDSCASFVAEICELKYGVRPSWVIDGQPDAEFAYVPVHLEYIVTELLKNAFRATVESENSSEPVVVTIAAKPQRPQLDGQTMEEDGSPGQEPTENERGRITSIPSDAGGITIRIRDRGGGISSEVLPKIWSYSFTTFGVHENSDGGADAGEMDTLTAMAGGGLGSSIAGLGYGLPLGRAYAEYFGGSIEVQSLYGWGCVCLQSSVTTLLIPGSNPAIICTDPDLGRISQASERGKVGIVTV
jgi:hypothetical protein